NVEAPLDGSLGPVQVTVTNANGTSDPISATMQDVLPGFFASQNYVAAVRSDGTIITGVASSMPGAGQAAKPGDVLQLYGRGFGATNPAVAPGLVFQGSYSLANAVTITIGGAVAPVSYAGLVGAGLYQFNVTVPNLAGGDHAVVAEILGQRTQPGVLLKVQG